MKKTKRIVLICIIVALSLIAGIAIVCIQMKTTQTPLDETESTEENGWLALKDWSADITIDGIVYSFPYSYEQFKENGWVSTDSNMTENYILEGNEMCSVNLINEDHETEYGGLMFLCEFRNYTNEAKSITECDMNHMTFDISGILGTSESYPEIDVVDGVGFGSTKEDIKEVFTNPIVDREINDTHYLLVYNDTLGRTLNFVIHEEYGVISIEISWDTYNAMEYEEQRITEEMKQEIEEEETEETVTEDLGTTENANTESVTDENNDVQTENETDSSKNTANGEEQENTKE